MKRAPFDGDLMAKITITRRSRHRILVLMLVVLMALVAIVARGSSQVGATGELPQGPIQLFDGSETAFTNFEGKPLVINFWASWCPACVAELPDVEAVHQQFNDEVTFIGIANADRRELAISLADSVGITYTLADDPDGDLFREFELIAMPTTLFITADGQIHSVFGGQLNERALIERVDELVAES